ncbi:membrane-spanning 4-domains subfamily A member 12 [Choloepus didactylus]|uniref:membrane-spanning 4-domains subfamily A member 12 n=1 Tax=Choloepus didactylus TaxID=27675 RepID=UPI0018A03751|nr:membrane-spanning 4-domains subfamily A member 12 [Choloepus didactylus]
MLSSEPTIHSGNLETTADPYLPNYTMVPEPQQPDSLINPVSQIQSGQPPFIITSGIITNGQQGQGNIQVVNSAIETSMKDFTEEARILGAIQIIIGLMHIGFGIVLGLTSISYGFVRGFASFAFVGGYPFWGGISFIASGTLSIKVSKDFSPCLIKGSLGMNIVSAIFAFIGVILLLVDMSINGLQRQDTWAVLSGRGISGMLAIFSLLELCITCITAHFANQANMNRSVLIIPTTCGTNPLIPASSSTPRNIGQPAYDPKY